MKHVDRKYCWFDFPSPSIQHVALIRNGTIIVVVVDCVVVVNEVAVYVAVGCCFVVDLGAIVMQLLLPSNTR